jgi:hypothetical protein
LEFTAGELSDSPSLPSPFASVSDTLTHSAAAAAELVNGAFKFGRVRIFGAVSDCPTTGTATCLYFDRLKQDSAGGFISSSWAYQPTSKTWLQLSATLTAPRIEYADQYNTGGATWSSGSAFNLYGSAQAAANGQWQYSNGQVSHRLFVNESSIAGRAMSDVAIAGNFPSDAKQIDVSTAQLSGTLVALKNPSIWKNADDTSTYPTLAAFRAAHVSNATPYCLHGAIDLYTGIVFNPSAQQGAIMPLKNSGFCASEALVGSEAYVQQSVATFGGRKTMLFQTFKVIPNGQTARDVQKLMAIGLNDKSQPASGWAYLPGYTVSSKGLYNYAAVVAWLRANTSDTQARTLPP